MIFLHPSILYMYCICLSLPPPPPPLGLTSHCWQTDAQSIAVNKHTDLEQRANVNWLIHIAFAQQDYKYCKEVIEYQFNETFDHEYLYYTKVSAHRVYGGDAARESSIVT